MASTAHILLEVLADTGDSKRKLAELSGELAGLDKQDANPEVDADTGPFKRAVNAAKAELRRLAADKATAEIDGDIKPLEQALRQARKDLKVLEANDGRLKLDADISDAEREFAKVGAQLKKLEAAQPEIGPVTADTARARLEFDQLEAKIAGLKAERANVQVGADTLAARARIDELEAKLNLLQLKRYHVNVDVDRDGTAVQKMGLLGRLSAGLIGKLTSFGSSAESAGQKTGFLGLNVGSLTGGLAGGLHPAILGVIAVLAGAFIPALAGLVSSFGAAVAGAGALAVGFGATLLPAAALAVGAISRFKAQANIAGTAANRLKTAAQGLSGTFSRVLAPASDSVFRGLASGLGRLQPMIRSLKPEFTAFGSAVGASFKRILTELSNPAWTAFFRTITNAATRLAPVLTTAFLAFARILRDLATAALPFVEAGLRKMAAALQGVNTSGFSAAIGQIVQHLGAWLRLGGAVFSAMTAFFSAVGPQILQFVNWLTRGVQAFAQWANSAAGRAEIRAFFAQVLPLVQSFISTVIHLGAVFLQFVQLVAPALKLVLIPLNLILSALSWLIVAMQKIQGVTASVVAAIVAAWNGAKGGLSAAWNAIKSAASSVWNAIKAVIGGAVRGAVSVVRSVWNAGKAAVTAVWRAIASAARSVWNAIKSAISSAVHSAVSVVRSVWNAGKSAVTSIWRAISSAARSVWNAIKSAISTAVHSAVSVVKSVWNAGKSAITTIWNGVKSAASRVWNSIKEAIVRAVKGAVSGVKNLAHAFFEAGVAIVKAIANGIKSVASLPINAIKSVAQGISRHLPHSEPKDPTSPLRGLHQSGQAIVDMLSQGIQSRQGALTLAMRKATVGLDVQAAGAGTTYAPNFNLYSNAYGNHDGETVIAKLDQKLRKQATPGRGR